MFWNRALLIPTIAVALFPSTSAALDANLYGRINVTLQDSDFGNGGEKTTGITNHSSRLGVKGRHELSSSLEAFYQMEFGVNVTGDEDSSKDDDVFSHRNQFVGLTGYWGTATVGRRDTALKLSQGKVDQFNEYEGDLNTLFKGDNRASQQLSYATPKYGVAALQFETTYVPERAEKQGGDTGFSVALKAGDVKYKNQPYYAAIAYDNQVAGYDVLRATLGGRLGDVELGAMYNQQEKSDSGESRDGYLVSAAYIMGKSKFKAQYQDGDGVDDAVKGSIYSVGVEHKWSKQLRSIAYYTDTDLDNGVDYGSAAAIGLRYDF